MRSRFDEELNDLNSELILMGALCEDAISHAVTCLLYTSLALALVVAGCTPANNEPADDQTNDPAAQNEEPVKLTVVTTAMTEPYSYYDTEDNLVGSEINLWNEISRRTGYEIEFTAVSYTHLSSRLPWRNLPGWQ